MNEVHVIDDTPFPHVRAFTLEEEADDEPMLIETLWSVGGVGALGGLPKLNKTWLCCDMAVSVATGTPCLGRFPVSRPGPVLVYAAEDSLATIRKRLAGLCAVRGIRFEDLDVSVITVPSMRLDRVSDQRRLKSTVVQVKPRMLILDPLVRVYGNIDENSASEVSRFLAYLRGLQREFETAVLLVHHARKSRSGAHSGGQALRGSGDLHAWTDHLLSLRRVAEGVQVTVEHRSAPAPAPLVVDLIQDGQRPPHLEIVTAVQSDGPEGLEGRLLHLLARHPDLATAEDIRKHLGLRKERVLEMLRRLKHSGVLTRQGGRWRVRDRASVASEPATRVPAARSSD